MHKSSPSKIWRKERNKYSITGVKSNKTGKVYFPPILVEPENGNTEFSEYHFKPEAKLISWSIVRAAPTGYEALTPYVVAILELEGGQKLTGEIVDVDPETLKKGDILRAIFRKVYSDGEAGVIHYGFKWTK